jgi:ABC-type transport system involved in multi-copper enzyme maturation permease subunit
MSILSRVLTVFEFELRRALVPTRLAWWGILAFFPVVLVCLLLSVPGARREIPTEVWTSIQFILISMLISMLGTFLWTAPAVSSELERQSWVYFAVRPHGRVAVLLGKYLAAVAWVLPATLVGATVCAVLLALFRTQVAESGQIMRMWWTIVRLCLLSVPAYAALFLALGTIFTKRAMVMSVAYTLIFELIVSFIPALINKLTIQFRLRALFLNWAGFDLSRIDRRNGPPIDLFSTAPSWQHVALIGVYILVMLTLAVTLIRQRDYAVATAADAN